MLGWTLSAVEDVVIDYDMSINHVVHLILVSRKFHAAAMAVRSHLRAAAPRRSV